MVTQLRTRVYIIMFCYYWRGVGPPSLRSLGSLVSSLSHRLDIEMLVLFCYLALWLCPLLFCLDDRLVLSCRSSVDPSPGHIIALIVPAYSNLVPSELGLRPACVLILVSFFLSFISVLFLPSMFLSFFALRLVLFFGWTHIPWLCAWYYFVAIDTRYGIPRLVIVPFTCVLILRCMYYFVFVHRAVFSFVACFVTTG